MESDRRATMTNASLTNHRVAYALVGLCALACLMLGFSLWTGAKLNGLGSMALTVGCTIVVCSGLVLLIMLSLYILQYLYPESYIQLMKCLKPTIAANRSQAAAAGRVTQDSPPPYKKSWAKTYQQRTSPSTTTGPEQQSAAVAETIVDLERHLEGRARDRDDVQRNNVPGGLSKWTNLRNAVLGSKTPENDSQAGSSVCQTRATTANDDGLPTFEVAVRELSAKELQKVYDNLSSSPPQVSLPWTGRFQTLSNLQNDYRADVSNLERSVNKINSNTSGCQILPSRRIIHSRKHLVVGEDSSTVGVHSTGGRDRSSYVSSNKVTSGRLNYALELG